MVVQFIGPNLKIIIFNKMKSIDKKLKNENNKARNQKF